LFAIFIEEESGKEKGMTTYIFVSTPSLAVLEAHASFDYQCGIRDTIDTFLLTPTC
jgi:hypothetical protein